MATTKRKSRKVRKLSDKKFLAILRENSGLFAKTAEAIQKQCKITYTRQSVRDRALKHPDEFVDIIEQTVDVAEDGLLTLMKSKNERIKLAAIETFLKAKGKDRGYFDKRELVGKDDTNLFGNVSDDKAKDLTEKIKTSSD
jgi:hypothetical protein